MNNLKDKVAVITGGGSGIGRVTALVLAQNGIRVVLGNRRKELGEETVSLIRDAGGEAIFQQTDVSNAADVEALMEKAVESFGHIDFAFNNAGVGVSSLLADQKEEDFDHLFSVNVKGVWLSMKYEIQQMLKQGHGIIVNNISVHGFRTIFPGVSVYTATKHAVLALTKAAAFEYAKFGIRVNGIAPGPIETDMLKASADTIGGIETWSNMLPMKRIGKPQEVANSVLWLFSDAAPFINGHILAIDGGFLAQ
ncbi:MAG: glucose 1-dehydrogenase [Tolypothrix sp. Co-bin9]|nr:glucose 1-dehydrogenase [Tolypothrix sp. Co-bin9]